MRTRLGFLIAIGSRILQKAGSSLAQCGEGDMTAHHRLRTASTFLITLAIASGARAGPLDDLDGDGVVDGMDNCIEVSNVLQIDTNGDLCGNACDADFDNNGGVGGTDFALWARNFGTTTGHPLFNPDLDVNSNGGVGGEDFAYWAASFGGIPGPSGLSVFCLGGS